jgi:tetratricopeptide (TPR) repeat protein
LGESRPLKELPGAGPDVFLLPLAVPEPARFVDLDPGVVARRIPDFLQQMLNHGGHGPAALLEIQTPPDDGPVGWVVLHESPDAESAFELLPDGHEARAVVTGTVAMDESGAALRVELHVHDAQSLETGESTTIRCRLPLADPVAVLRRVARRLARILDVDLQSPAPGLLTGSGPAFFKFLEGLDGAAMLSEASAEREADRALLIAPFAEALRLDPAFGLALRAAQISVAQALEGEHLDQGSCLQVFDSCFDASPSDGEGCVAIAAQLAVMGDDDRAVAWLEHAVKLPVPPARGLENLGIFCANRGDTVRARNLWLEGLAQDGHPDFFAHLARLAFGDGDEHEAWDKVLRGLRRIYERCVRASEWDDDDRSAGVLLRYLVDHLAENRPPEEAVEALTDLCGLLDEGCDRIDLGLCLLRAGAAAPARSELLAGLAGEPESGYRDQAIRALLALEIDDFERRFGRAVDLAIGHRDPKPALAEFERFLDLQPRFWPALFFKAVALRRLGSKETALDLLADVLQLSPQQSDALALMAELFAERGNPKRALELIDEAIRVRDADAELHLLRARFLRALDRADDAREALAQASRLDPQAQDARARRSRD